MIACNEAAGWIPLYIDNELAPAEMTELEDHLRTCDGCRNDFARLRSVSDNIRAACPLYEPSSEGARRIGLMVRGATRAARRRRLSATALAACLLLSLPFLYWLREAPESFSQFAAAAHVRYANGTLPLDLASGETATVSHWLAPRLAFHFKLPNYVNEPGSLKRYSLAGTRLLQYRDSDVAYLAYTMNQRPISLLVASSSRVTPAGGQRFRAGGIDFHFSSDRGLRLITWTDRGLSYALVSDLEVTGAESCVICHGSPAERRKIETLPH